MNNNGKKMKMSNDYKKDKSKEKARYGRIRTKSEASNCVFN